MSARLRAISVLLAVFAAGLVFGVFFERRHSVDAGAADSAAAEHEATIAELREVVGLDDDQMQQVHGILARHQRIVQVHWEELRPEVQNAMRRVHMEIADLLHPDQRQRYHEWLELQRNRHLRLAAPPARAPGEPPSRQRPESADHR
jgi:hypothetical protein